MRISRPCYDKYFRCPGWNGGGTKFGKVQSCDSGHLKYDILKKRLWKWRFNTCDTCNVLVLPYVIRYADWRYLVNWKIRFWCQELRYRRRKDRKRIG